ncbi:MAG: sugar phosphate isomerase/epimerase [Bacteroidetes bacterium]|nr:sugar phosphate isomerase/epimerase [Bacteroidota bacterium]MDA1119863.1 sugar phosphate isomerase/epimerase [Bacteroidota bacterium]
MMDRRSFLMNSLGVAALGSLGSFQYTQTKKPLNKKSLKFGMIQGDLTVLQKFQLVKDLGFDGVELDSPNDLDEKEILEARDKTGLLIPGVVNSVHWKKPLSDPDPSVRKECATSMIGALNKCKLYGGTTVLLVPAVVNETVGYDEAWERSTVEIKKLLPEAEKTGIKIAIENVWNNFLISPMEAARYIDQFDSEYIGWYFDVGNIIRYGWPDQWVRILGKRILKVDIKEYSRDKQRNEGIWEGFNVEIGDADSDWAKVNKALREVGYSGWGSAEVPGGDSARLKEISERMDKIYAL